MLRVEYNSYGGPEQLKLVQFTPGNLEKDQVQVRVRAAAINSVDWKIRAGALRMMTGSKFPRGMGQDFAGVVEAVGPDVRRFKAGDEVFGAMEMREAAAFAEAIVTPEHTMTHKPDNVTFEHAAALATVGQTAWTALVDVGGLKAGKRIFINGCLGMVGRCAVQIGRVFQAEISGTCSQGGLTEAKNLGVDKPFDYRQFRAGDHRGQFDIILDTFGNLSAIQCSRMLQKKGVATHINPTFFKMLLVMLSHGNKLVFLKTSSNLLSKVSDMAEERTLTLPISKTAPLVNAITTVSELESSGTSHGKVIIIP